jgi:hypothetical protein
MSNPSLRKNKVYIVLILEYPENGGDGGLYDSASIAFTTLEKAKIDEIQRLWDIVQNKRYENSREEAQKALDALKELQNKFGIITWSGVELRIEEEELK